MNQNKIFLKITCLEFEHHKQNYFRKEKPWNISFIYWNKAVGCFQKKTILCIKPRIVKVCRAYFTVAEYHGDNFFPKNPYMANLGSLNTLLVSSFRLLFNTCYFSGKTFLSSMDFFIRMNIEYNVRRYLLYLIFISNVRKFDTRVWFWNNYFEM